MNVFNCILKDKVTIIIPCFVDDCDVEGILDKLSEQYYVDGLSVLVFNDKLDKETLDLIEGKQKELPCINIEVINDVNKLYDRKTPHIFFIENSSRLLSKWSIFNLVKRSKDNRKQFTNKLQKVN